MLRRLALWFCIVALLGLLIPTAVRVKAEETISPFGKTVYVVCIGGVPSSWIDPKVFREGWWLNDIKPLGFEVKYIETWEDYDKLFQEPPDGAIIINAHGEFVPCPPSLAGAGTKDDAIAFLQHLAHMISEHHWVFVMPAGAAFWKVIFPPSKPADLGEDGLKAFMSALGFDASLWATLDGVPEILYAYKTDAMKEAEAKYLNETLPDELPACRAITATIEPAVAFYACIDPDTGEPFAADAYYYYGVAAYKLGKGFYIHVGYHTGDGKTYEVPDEVRAKVGFAAAFYTLIDYAGIPEEKLKGKVYIVAPEDHKNWWLDRDKARDTLVALLEARGWKEGVDFFVIKSDDEFLALLSNPPEGAVIFNCLGEPVPGWGKTDMTPWEYMAKLGELVRNHGWTWVHLSGYPFYEVEGDQALFKFLSAAGDAGAICAADRSYRDALGFLTKEALAIRKMMGLKSYDVFGGAYTQRAIMTNAPILFAVYEVPHWPGWPADKFRYGPRYGFALIWLGGGIYVHGGSGAPDHVKAHSTAIALYALAHLKFAELKVTVVDRETGKPIVGAKVKAYMRPAYPVVNITAYFMGEAETDENGVATFVLPSELLNLSYVYYLEVGAPGYAPVVTDDFHPTPGTYELKIEMRKVAAAVGVTVTDAEGKPIVGATIRVLDATGATVAEGTTDEEGKVGLTLKPGDYTFEVYWLGIKAYSETVTITGDTTLSFTVPAYTVTVKAVDAEGKPISGASVTLLHEGKPIARATTDASGVAKFAQIPKGEYTVTIMVGTMKVYEEKVTISKATELTASCALYRLVVKVTSKFGFKVSGAVVEVITPTGARLRKITGADGTATFDRLLPGKYTIRVFGTERTVEIKDRSIAVTIKLLQGVDLLITIIIIVIIAAVVLLVYKRAKPAAPAKPAEAAEKAEEKK